MEVAWRCSLEDLIQLQKREKSAQHARNLQIIVLAARGWTAPAIAMAVGLTRRVVQTRVAAYNAEGLAGLHDDRGAPSDPLLTPTEQAAFEQSLPEKIATIAAQHPDK